MRIALNIFEIRDFTKKKAQPISDVISLSCNSWVDGFVIRACFCVGIQNENVENQFLKWNDEESGKELKSKKWYRAHFRRQTQFVCLCESKNSNKFPLQAKVPNPKLLT